MPCDKDTAERAEGSVEVSNSTSAPACASEPTAARDLGSHLRLWLIAAIGLGLDLWTKHLAFTRLDSNPSDRHGYVAIEGLMSFRRSLNSGALFGLGKGLTPIFIGASLLALGFVLFLFIHSGRSRRSLHIALALVLAGALGNLYDRTFMIADVVRYTVANKQYTEVGKIVNPGETPIKLGTWPDGRYARTIPPRAEPEVSQNGVVRDFIKMEPRFEIAGYKVDMWPWVFNIADVLLVFGVGILMLNFWWERKEEPACEPSSPSEQPQEG